jgi:hypothetical protein
VCRSVMLWDLYWPRWFLLCYGTYTDHVDFCYVMGLILTTLISVMLWDLYWPRWFLLCYETYTDHVDFCYVMRLVLTTLISVMLWDLYWPRWFLLCYETYTEHVDFCEITVVYNNFILYNIYVSLLNILDIMDLKFTLETNLGVGHFMVIQ